MCISASFCLLMFTCESFYYSNNGKSMDWFLYDRDLRHERVNLFLSSCFIPPKNTRKPKVAWSFLEGIK